MPGVADVLVASELGDRRGFRLMAEADQLLAALSSPDSDAPVRSEDVRLFLGFADRPNDLLRRLSGPGLSLAPAELPALTAMTEKAADFLKAKQPTSMLSQATR